MNSVEITFKSWPLETPVEPEGFAGLTLTTQQITNLFEGCERSSEAFAGVLLHKDRDIIMSPDWKGFPFAGYYREDYFRNKMDVLIRINSLRNGLDLAKQIRRSIQDNVDPEIIFQTAQSNVQLSSEEKTFLRGYIPGLKTV